MIRLIFIFAFLLIAAYGINRLSEQNQMKIAKVAAVVISALLVFFIFSELN